MGQQINGSKIWQTKWTKGAQIDVPREKFANAIATANSVCVVGARARIRRRKRRRRSRL